MARSSRSSNEVFRICTEVFYSRGEEMAKYLILVDKRSFNDISDLSTHIKKVCKFEQDIELTINDCLLPEGESINIIQENDTLVVRLLGKKYSKKKKLDPIREKKSRNSVNTDVFSQEEISDYGQCIQRNSRKRKSHQSFDESYEEQINSCIKELRIKRDELEAGEIDGSEKVDETVVSNVEDNTLFPPPKRKRKRKHKKKNNVNSHEVSETSNIPSDVDDSFLNKNNAEVVGDQINNPSSACIQFNDEEELETGQDQEKISDNCMNGNEVQNHILNLLDKPKSERTFKRQTIALNNNVSPQNSDHNHLNNDKSSLKSSKVKDPENGQTISFTKLKIGENYCPEPSKKIIGKIVDLRNSGDSPIVILEILEGHEEFREPNGKFSLEDYHNDMKDSSSKITTVEIRWNEILDPHLYSI